MDKLKQIDEALQIMIDHCRSSECDPVRGMEVVTSAAVKFMILVSETAGRNTLGDLYSFRRQLTAIINDYKKGGPYHD